MNKIYKVIWSKTRNCYVAVAEFVKRNGKGGSVLNRRHIAAALAAVAICAAPAGVLANSGGHSEDDGDYYGDDPYNVVINETVNGYVYGRCAPGPDGVVSGATVTVEAGATVSINVYGGYALNNRNAEDNTVSITGGTVNVAVYGGCSESGSAKGNTVRITGGTVEDDVYGGYSMEGDATNNTVILSKEKEAPVLGRILYGGYSGSGGDVSDNTLQVEAVGLSAKQIRNFENYKFVLPFDIKANDTMLTLTNQFLDVSIDGTKASVSMASGTVADIGLNLGESVTLLEKTSGDGKFTVDNTNSVVYAKPLDDVTGGLPVDVYRVTAPSDKLNVTYTEHYLYGDGGTNTPGQREKGNTLTINNGKADVAFGGRAATGAVTENKVIMTGGEILKENRIDIKNEYAGNINVSGMLFGGFADNGDVEKNTVEISGGTVNSWVIGGFSWDGKAENNTVILSKEKEAPVLNGTLFGGYGNRTISNNTLQVEAVGLSAPEIRKFDNYRFVLPKDIKAGDTMLTLKSQINNLEIDAAKVSVSSNVGKTGLNLDESVTLLHKKDGSGTFNVENLTGAVQTSKLDGEAGGFDVMKYTLDKP
ncbi:ESPR domain-containing protein, partial [uncultured Succiniclasticum sp.]|uniref:ESPR domain-containing protein n=1 Tax=uncultured Succiniclasticum sp. TaxID=1500547 RepID=UPI0025DDDC0B